MDPQELNEYKNCSNLFAFQREGIESLAFGVNFCELILELDKLFQFFKEHFKALYQKKTLWVMLTFVHRCLEGWIKRGNYSDDIGILLVNLIAEHSGKENAINIVFQIIFQCLNSIKYFGTRGVHISEKLLNELIAVIPLIESRTVASNCIACINQYLEIFPERRKSLETLWSYLKKQLQVNLETGITKDIEIDILIQLIDDFKSVQANFHDEPILLSTIQHLLKSDEKKLRKYGYYLLKKYFHYVIENINSADRTLMTCQHIRQIERSWIMYDTILENLEEEQSHLILPSLENLEELVKNKYLPSSLLNILYLRILTHNNHLITRWSIEFFLKNFTSSDLSGEILKHLLQATNSNSLFNCEDYFLKEDYLTSFLKGDVKIVFTLLSEIDNWKSIPLYIWLKNLNETHLPNSLTFKEILKISACVRKLQNRDIRKLSLYKCKNIFKDSIQKMSMQEYVTYVETIYNTGDEYLEHEIFYSKKSSLVESKTVEGSIFKQRFYEIFTNSKYDKNKLLSFLNDLPVEEHGWLKYATFKLELAECDQQYIKNLYKLDLSLLACCDIHNIINIFKNSLIDLPIYDKHELSECTQAAISFFIYQRSSFKMDEDEETMRFILNTGIKNNNVALNTFAAKLLNDTEEQIDLWFIDELIKYDSYQMLKYVGNYLCRLNDENIVKKYAITILKKTYFSFKFHGFNILKHVADVWFKELPSQGDKRIEESFLFHHCTKNSVFQRLFLRGQMFKYSDEQYVLDLIKYHKDITKNKPRYFEYSNEHRIKIKIAELIFYYVKQKLKTNENVLDQIWDIVLNENNQLNIKYFYELILGTQEPRVELILNKLKEAQNLTPSQQLSVISIAYTNFLCKTSTKEQQDTLVYSLLSFTMGENFQTRLLAQMSLHQLLEQRFEITEDRQRIIQSIEDVAGEKLSEYLNDIRLHLYNLIKFSDFISYNFRVILYMTNAPFDVIDSVFSPTDSDFKQITDCRKWYMDKFNTGKIKETAPQSLINDQVQRKMNPVDGLTEPHSLMVIPDEDNSAEMFVVASLIDKLPSLEGIALFCKVLGIKNLVMDSISHIENDDFENLSTTAENNLKLTEVKPKDLWEFLIQKKLEGFNIVGAEQTCNSENFINFKFPRKCVLLLGHEKDGIPAPLFGLIDNAVKIPQFGKVHSLNVNVTGALFMLEYCKHLMKK